MGNNKNPSQKQPGERRQESSISIQATCLEKPAELAKKTDPMLGRYTAAMSNKTKTRKNLSTAIGDVAIHH